jgi:hypothetical protein
MGGAGSASKDGKGHEADSEPMHELDSHGHLVPAA